MLKSLRQYGFRIKNKMLVLRWNTWAVLSAKREFRHQRGKLRQSKNHSWEWLTTSYGNFIQCLADLSSPLNNLLKKDVQWNWSAECQESFAKIKETLTSTEVLAHSNPDVPLGLACTQCTCWSSPDEVTGKETCLVASH